LCLVSSTVVVAPVFLDVERTGKLARRSDTVFAAHHSAVMVMECQWTGEEELGSTKGWIVRSNRAVLGTSLKSAQDFEGIRIDLLAERTRYAETMRDPRYFEARSVCAVRAHWLA